jgi:anti-sigma B factor antagonist
VTLQITTREVGEVEVLDLKGRLVLGEETNTFREKMKDLLAAGKKKIVLNLANVSYIDSAGLGTLVSTFHSARSQGAMLKLANLGSKFKEVLQVTKLMTVFDTYDNEAKAIAGFDEGFAFYHCPTHGTYPGPPPCPRCVPSLPVSSENCIGSMEDSSTTPRLRYGC